MKKKLRMNIIRLYFSLVKHKSSADVRWVWHWSLVQFLCPTRHKIGYFKDALPSQFLCLVLKN